MILGGVLLLASRLINDFWFRGYRFPTQAERIEYYVSDTMIVVVFLCYKLTSSPLIRVRCGKLMLGAGMLAVAAKCMILTAKIW